MAPDRRAVRSICLLCLLLSLALAGAGAMAEDHKVKEKATLQETVDRDEVDGYLFKLDEGDKATWRVNLVSGEKVNVRFMDEGEYIKLRDGTGSPEWYGQYSKDNTDFFEATLKVDASKWTGDFAIAVFTQDVVNATSTYDIEVRLTRAPEPQGLLDQICGLGTGQCIGISIAAVFVLIIVYIIYKNMRKAAPDGRRSTERPEVRYVDTMMRPGLDIPVGPVTEEKRATKKRRRKKKGKGPVGRKGKKAGKKGSKAGRGRAEAVTVVEVASVECPNCGEEVPQGRTYCKACGTDLEVEEVLECPVCGHSNPSGTSRCGGCGAEFE